MRAGLISQLGKSEGNANNSKNSIKQLKRASSVILLCNVWSHGYVLYIVGKLWIIAPRKFQQLGYWCRQLQGCIKACVRVLFFPLKNLSPLNGY